MNTLPVDQHRVVVQQNGDIPKHAESIYTFRPDKSSRIRAR
jgi:hypothetical protein